MPCKAILSSIQLDGTLRYTTFSGGTTVEKFKRYLETDLLPHLNGNSVLIMDNMKSHHAKAVKNVLDSSGVWYIFLPPYSPDLNPIERLWSKVCYIQSFIYPIFYALYIPMGFHHFLVHVLTFLLLQCSDLCRYINIILRYIMHVHLIFLYQGISTCMLIHIPLLFQLQLE